MFPLTFLFRSRGRSQAPWPWEVSLRFQESACGSLRAAGGEGQVSRAGEMDVPWPHQALGQPHANVRVTHL